MAQSNEEMMLADERKKIQKFQSEFHEMIEGYIDKDTKKEVQMNKPRETFFATDTIYVNKTFQPTKTQRLGKDKAVQSTNPDISKKLKSLLQKKFDPYSHRAIPTERRGITLRQLKAIAAVLERRCEKENWMRVSYITAQLEEITYENATLYDINKHIIIPFTKLSQKSLVETLPSTAGPQPPRFFVSHFWGEPLVRTIQCLEQMIRDFARNDDERYNYKGAGMTEDTPLWICAFANNQNNLNHEITDDPADTGFSKALKIACYRTISIVDEDIKMYSRLWCVYELYKTLMLPLEMVTNDNDDDLHLHSSNVWSTSYTRQSIGLLAVYTAHQHQHRNKKERIQRRSAVGIIQGGAPSDNCDAKNTVLREKHFPIDRIVKGVTVMIQNAKASRMDDRTHILNAIIGRSGNMVNEEPLQKHNNYNKLNNAVRGAFASTTAAIVGAYDQGQKEHWDDVLLAMKHRLTNKLSFNFTSEISVLSAEDTTEMVRHFPI